MAIVREVRFVYNSGREARQCGVVPKEGSERLGYQYTGSPYFESSADGQGPSLQKVRFLGYVASMQSDERSSVVSGEVKVAHVELEVACTMGLIAQSCASLKSERAGRVPT